MTWHAEQGGLSRRERFCRLYDFQPVDRSVRWEAVCFWPETVDAWIAQGGLPAGTDAMVYYGLTRSRYCRGQVSLCRYPAPRYRNACAAMTATRRSGRMTWAMCGASAPMAPACRNGCVFR